MVAPAKNAVGCDECHNKNGRMQDVEGIFIPGRDARVKMDMVGWGAALLTLIGVIVHAIIRVVSYFRRRICPTE
jgi:hypothetical protein